MSPYSRIKTRHSNFRENLSTKNEKKVLFNDFFKYHSSLRVRKLPEMHENQEFLVIHKEVQNS